MPCDLDHLPWCELRVSAFSCFIEFGLQFSYLRIERAVCALVEFLESGDLFFQLNNLLFKIKVHK